MVYYDGKRVEEDDEEVDLSGENYDYPRLRGVLGFDQDWSEIMIDAGVAEVAAALASLKAGAVVPYEVDEGELKQASVYYTVFRLIGVPWTYLHHHSNHPVDFLDGEIKEPDRMKLSRQLETRVISFGVSDTADAVSYDFHDRGVLREAFSAMSSELERFESRDREVELGEEVDQEEFSEQFLVLQDALFAGAGFAESGSSRLKPETLPNTHESARFVLVP